MKLSFTTVEAAAVESNPLAVPVLAADGAFVGTFTPTRFATEDGLLVAKGILHGEVHGDVAVIERTALPVTGGHGDAATLRLTLGPADVTVLGQPTRLEAAELAVTGRSGLQVNLVCAAIQLFDRGEGPAVIPDVLNQILART